MPRTRARASARRRSSPSSRRSWPAPTRGRSSGAPPPSSAVGLHLEGSASPWRRAAPFASPTSWWQAAQQCLARCRSARALARRSLGSGAAASTRLRARCGVLRRAKGPNCKAANLPDPHARGKNRRSDRSPPSRGEINIQPPCVARAGNPRARFTGCPTCKAKAVRDAPAAPSACKDSSERHGTPSQHRRDR